MLTGCPPAGYPPPVTGRPVIRRRISAGLLFLHILGVQKPAGLAYCPPISYPPPVIQRPINHRLYSAGRLSAAAGSPPAAPLQLQGMAGAGGKGRVWHALPVPPASLPHSIRCSAQALEPTLRTGTRAVASPQRL
jgi:hypothetical protein